VVNKQDDVTWIQIDGTRCLAIGREWSVEEQARTVERVAHALEALAQHGSTSAEESLVGVRLADAGELRSAGIEVVPLDVFRASVRGR
jgi:hypothetical protein